MAFDERLADRIRKRLGKRDGVSEKKMFGQYPFRRPCASIVSRLPTEDSRRFPTSVRLDPGNIQSTLPKSDRAQGQ